MTWTVWEELDTTNNVHTSICYLLMFHTVVLSPRQVNIPHLLNWCIGQKSIWLVIIFHDFVHNLIIRPIPKIQVMSAMVNNYHLSFGMDEALFYADLINYQCHEIIANLTVIC